MNMLHIKKNAIKKNQLTLGSAASFQKSCLSKILVLCPGSSNICQQHLILACVSGMAHNIWGIIF
ncbi:hypothetical protein AU255_10630 [Methyloprofundus sedimenti]|uniref:Uncharacterized protein n=1 Tax=Methyloprofundus sedimenti TaxID=1420851 RepID=A0A1V8M9N9_9GAMM|nr:hypothetical protein AU255_10630 [Methyloprofundus sedimenti]